MAAEKLGPDRSSYIFLSSLCVHPAKQGLGLGARLVKHIIDKAEAESRTVWLISGNVDNTVFYKKCGFMTVGEYRLGEDNPSWDEPPVVVRAVSSHSV